MQLRLNNFSGIATDVNNEYTQFKRKNGTIVLENTTLIRNASWVNLLTTYNWIRIILCTHYEYKQSTVGTLQHSLRLIDHRETSIEIDQYRVGTHSNWSE